jgi:hypothetical protein
MSDEVTTHQIEGVCGGVMMKGDWQEFHIDIGKQYPVKLASKHDDVKAAVAAAGAQKAVWTYTQRDGNPNPHRPGEFFKNRYLSTVEVGGTLDPALASEQGSSTTQGATHLPGPEGRERSIERQTIIKAAIFAFPKDKIETEDDWFALLTRLDGWISEKPAEVPQPTPTEVATPPADAVDPDDDIPF